MANAQGIRAGRAYVEVGTDESQLEKGLRAAEAKVKEFGKAIASIGAKLGALGAAITAPLLGAAKTFADSGSALHDMAERTGVSVEALSTLGFAARQSGTDMETVEGAIRKMQKALVAGSEENIQAEATFESLGMSVEDLMALSPEQQFEALGSAIAAIPNPTARAGAALQVFGKSGTALLPLLHDFAELSDQAREFGLVASTEAADAADRLGDAMDLLHDVIGSVVKSVGSALAPVLTEWSVILARIGKQIKDFVAAHKPMIDLVFRVGVGLTIAGAAFVALGVAISGVGATLGTVATLVGGVTTLFAAIVSPIGLVVAGLTGLTTWFLTSTKAGSQALSFLGDAFRDLAKVATDAFKGIGDALKAGDIQLAGQILWAGLKVEWLKGTNYIKGVWSDWSTAIVATFRGVQFKIAGAWIDAMAGLEKTLAKTTGNLTGIWNDAIVAIIKKTMPLEGMLGKVFGVDIGKALQDAVGNAVSDAGKADMSGKLGEIEKRRKDTQAALAGEQKAEEGNRGKGNEEARARDAAALKAAQDDLAGLLAKAKAGAAGVGAPALGKAPGMPSLPDIEELDNTLQETKDKTEVSGGFQAAALAGMGVGKSVEDEQLDEQKKMNNHLEKLNQKARVGQLVFS